MPALKKVQDEQILDAYRQTGNIWKAAQVVGLCGQSVHERLARLDAIYNPDVYTPADLARIRDEYGLAAASGKLAELAGSMGRSKSNLCRKARALGLTDKYRARPYLADASSRHMKDWLAHHAHPRGMAGKTHNETTRRTLGRASSARWAALTLTEKSEIILRRMKTRAAKGNLITPRPQASWKSAWRVIGGQRCYFRSRWEANYARYLELLRVKGEIAKWEHEPVTFWFEKIRRGTRSYLPDFRVTYPDGSEIFHEVKGWVDARSKTKAARMKRYHPKVRVIVIGQKEYTALEKQFCKIIPGWETAKSPLPVAA